MNRYRYEAADALGRISQGQLEADSPAAVIAQLRGLGLSALQVEQEQGASTAGGLFSARLSDADLAWTTRQLASLLAAGLPLEGALSATLEQAERKHIAQVLGADFKDNAIELDAEREDVRLTGFAGVPTFNRGNSAHQYAFVNGRPVQDKQILSAIRGAYAETIPQGRYPVAVLSLTLDPALVALVRQAVAAVHGMGAAPDEAGLDEGTRAAIAYARRMPFEHTAITDAEAAAMVAYLGEPGFVAFSVVTALADAECRAALVDLPELAAG